MVDFIYLILIKLPLKENIVNGKCYLQLFLLLIQFDTIDLLNNVLRCIERRVCSPAYHLVKTSRKGYKDVAQS